MIFYRMSIIRKFCLIFILFFKPSFTSAIVGIPALTYLEQGGWSACSYYNSGWVNGGFPYCYLSQQAADSGLNWQYQWGGQTYTFGLDVNYTSGWNAYAPKPGQYVLEVYGCEALYSPSRCSINGTLLGQSKSIYLNGTENFSSASVNFSSNITFPILYPGQVRSSFCVAIRNLDSGIAYSSGAGISCTGIPNTLPAQPYSPPDCLISLNMGRDITVDIPVTASNEIPVRATNPTGKVTIPIICQSNYSIRIPVNITFVYTTASVNGSNAIKTTIPGLGIVPYLGGRAINSLYVLQQTLTTGINEINLGYSLIRDPKVKLENGRFSGEMIIIINKY